ncbi:MAG: hypothetical protein Q7S05_03275 [bacterium]|nr:hypothetical protein [bacterium]
MTRFIDREKARALRAKGKSYSEIKQKLNISKSTLSGWLNNMPLSREQIRLLRDLNPRRIEHFRETMRKKREVRLALAYERAKKDIGKLSRRNLFLAGFYLYWGEGNKSSRGQVGISNTNPAIILAFMSWIKLSGVPRSKLSVKLHLYSDMNQEKETVYWSDTLSIPRSQFRKAYIKTSSLSGLTYKNGYGHGTCNVFFENIALWEYITMALRYIGEQHPRP